MLALIDGDIFRYRCAFAAERSKYLVELTNASGHKEYKVFDGKREAEDYGKRVVQGVNAHYTLWNRRDLQPLENCLQIVKSSLENTLEDIRRQYGKVDYRIWLSGKKNFRDLVAVSKPYKGNRDFVPKPTYYMDVATYLREHWNATWTEGIEADDALGIAAMEAKEQGKEYIIVSNDKDLKQIPGNHYDWIKKEYCSVSPKDAKFQLFSQILSGDATDNIPGLEGIGPATAAKILEGAQSPEDMVDSVVSTYMLEFETYPDKYPKVSWDTYLAEMWALVYILKLAGPNTQHDYEDEWKITKEGKYFCSKYLQSSAVASSLSR